MTRDRRSRDTLRNSQVTGDRRFTRSGEGADHPRGQRADMKFNMLVGALFLGVGVVLVVVGGWFGLLVGIVALLMGVALVFRGYRLRSART